MVKISGSYQHIKNENFVEYLKASGLPEEKAKVIDSLHPKYIVNITENRVSVRNDSGAEISSSYVFTYNLDEEVKEQISNNFIKIVAKLDGNELAVTSKDSNGKTEIMIYKFSDTELVVNLKTDKDSLIGRRYFTRV